MSDEKDKLEYSTSHAEHAGHIPASPSDVVEEGYGDDVDPHEGKRIIRRVDVRLLIILGALYSVALIDRTNLSTARVLGMGTELKLTVGERYSLITLVFFIPYIIFELPANLLLRKVGARNLIVTIVILWGMVMTLMGIAKNWIQMLGLRIVLGFFESAFFPACVFIISTWYTRWETQKRMALFYLMSMAVAGFSQILGYGLAHIPPAGVLHTWRYVFFVEGLLTIALGILAWFLIVDFPDRNKFLSERETKWVIWRVNVDRGDGTADEITGKKVLKHLMDVQTWMFGLCFMSATLPSYAFSYFLPVILAGGGYSTVASLCLSAPPYLFAAIYTFAVAWGSDRFRQRGAFVALNAVVCIIGCAIIGWADKFGVRLFGSFLAIAGAQANVPGVLSYQANNCLSHSKKAVASAIVVGMGGVGGIMASTVFRQADYPRYLPGLWATIGAQLLIITFCGILTLWFTRINKALDEGRREPINGHASFRYSI